MGPTRGNPFDNNNNRYPFENVPLHDPFDNEPLPVLFGGDEKLDLTQYPPLHDPEAQAPIETLDPQVPFFPNEPAQSPRHIEQDQPVAGPVPPLTRRVHKLGNAWTTEEIETVKRAIMEKYKMTDFKEVRVKFRHELPIRICSELKTGLDRNGRAIRRMFALYLNIPSKPNGRAAAKLNYIRSYWDRQSIEQVIAIVKSRYKKASRDRILSGKLKVSYKVREEISQNIIPYRNTTSISLFLKRGLGKELTEKEKENEALLHIVGQHTWGKISELMAVSFPRKNKLTYQNAFYRLKNENSIIKINNVYHFFKQGNYSPLDLNENQVRALDWLMNKDVRKAGEANNNMRIDDDDDDEGVSNVNNDDQVDDEVDEGVNDINDDDQVDDDDDEDVNNIRNNDNDGMQESDDDDDDDE